MIGLTRKEQEALLILYKDFTSYYNANSLSKKLEITQVGTMKLLKRFEKADLVISKKIGKSIVYKINFENDYVKDLISFLLSNEANRFKRWKDEFKELYKEGRIVLFYGSASRNYSQARDIDIMIVRKKGDSKEIAKEISRRQQFLPKKIHDLDLTAEELISNAKKRKKVIIDIIKTAIVLYGQTRYVKLIENVTSI